MPPSGQKSTLKFDRILSLSLSLRRELKRTFPRPNLLRTKNCGEKTSLFEELSRVFLIERIGVDFEKSSFFQRGCESIDTLSNPAISWLHATRPMLKRFPRAI